MAATLLESLKKTIGKKKANSQAFAWLADLERESGDLDTALQRVDGGLTLYPNDVPAMLVRSMLLFQKEDFEGCVAQCEIILKSDPFCLSAQKRMGDAYDKLGRENDRNKCYRRVHDMDPLDPFWKEEYENVTDDAAAATAAAGMAAMGDDDFAMPDDLSMPDSDTASPDEASDAAPAAEVAPFSNVSSMDDSVNQAVEMAVETAAQDDDPFAALSALMPNVDSVDEAAMDSLQASLDSAMAEMADDEPSAPEVFPEEDKVSGDDVSSALSSMFGVDDDLEPETPSSPFGQSFSSQMDEPAEPAGLGSVQSSFGSNKAVDDDQPQSVDSAFTSIFGEDELPEEKPQNTAKPAESDKLDDQPQSVDSAFASIFGEDELPEEKPQNTAKPAESTKLDEDQPQSVDSAFTSIFGEDELPEEKPQTAAPLAGDDLSLDMPQESDSGSLFEKSSDLDSGSLAGDSDSGSSLFEKSESSSIFEKSSDESVFDKSTLADDLEMPAEGGAFEKSAEESAFDKSADELVFDKSALADDLEMPAEGGVFEKSAEDNFAAPAIEGNSSVFDDMTVDAPAAAPAEAPAEEKPFSVDSAFDSLFGEDSLPEEKPQGSVETPVAEEAPVASLAEQVSSAEDELSLPSVEANDEKSDDLAKEMGGAFANIFGTDDDLDLPETKIEPAVAAEPAPSQEDTGAAIEEAKSDRVSLEADIDKSFNSLFGDDSESSEKAEDLKPADAPAVVEESLEKEIDGAFKGLFNMNDDSLPETEESSNKGVDFLMSGDSDDEVSSGLIKNPSAPLERGAADLDESLNTRTLAEIYFEQGLYGKALDIYEDLARKEPDNMDIANRMVEIEKVYREKTGGENNG
ncbi:MAG: hypothetical protein MJY82_05640 [Fibrobacter sp.]|nr:hypothetical protein [Fibrobacter sp.]